MSKQQATGLDTRMMIPVYAGLFFLFAQLFLPVISIPALKYEKLPVTYRVFQLESCIENLQTLSQTNGRLTLDAFTSSELSMIFRILFMIQLAAGITLLLSAAAIYIIFLKKRRALPFIRLSFGLHGCYCLFLCIIGIAGNILLNQKCGRSNQFLNLSVYSHLQITSWVYGQLLLSIGILFFAGGLMDTTSERRPQNYIVRTQKKDRSIGKRTLFSLLILFLGIPFCIFFGIFFLNDRSNVFIGLCIVLLAMLPFAMVFEDRHPQARELLLIAVMSGIAVAGRVAFFMLPQFKPITAVIIIAGVGLGAEAGFLTGAVSGFVSNFFFGQGPWTPWQMFAFGLIGFLAGILFRRNNSCTSHKREQLWKLSISIYGFFSTFIIYGLIMDFSSALTFSQTFSREILLGKIISGLPFNLIHAISTVVFLYFLALPMQRKLNRIRKKYGMLEV